MAGSCKHDKEIQSCTKGREISVIAEELSAYRVQCCTELFIGDTHFLFQQNES